MSVTQEIKERLDIVDIVAPYVKLRKAGRRFTGFCPFHHNTRSPSFYVFPETQTWHCFGACAEGGDIFNFVMKKEGWDFKEALEQLAKRANVTLKPVVPQSPEQKEKQTRLATLLDQAADYFHQLLLHAPQAETARAYVNQRALKPETVAEFKLGFALNSFDACRTHFLEQGFTQADLLAAGLQSENEERGTVYDRFRNRLMFPISNIDGQIVGFGARTLEKDGIPKYLNSPQTAQFDKGRLVYGLDRSKRHIREARQAVIVEGYMDVLQAWQAGFRNVVAQMGTALTEAQLGQLKRSTKRLVIALDPDEAGVKATMRSLQVARETLDREIEVKFDPRGLVRHEGRLKADIRVMQLPDGMDPDDFIRERTAEWPQMVANAQPIVAYVVDTLAGDVDISDPKAKSAVAQQIVPLIGDIADPVERDHYWQLLARKLQTDERALRRLEVKPTKMRQPKAMQPQAAPSVQAVDKRQANFLCQCLHHPSLIDTVNQQLRRSKQPTVSGADFSSAEDRALFDHLLNVTQTGVGSSDEVWDSLDAVLRERANFLIGLDLESAAEVERLPQKLMLSILDWRSHDLRQRRSELKHLITEARQANEKEQADMLAQQLQATVLMGFSIDKARSDLFSATKERT